MSYRRFYVPMPARSGTLQDAELLGRTIATYLASKSIDGFAQPIVDSRSAQHGDSPFEVMVQVRDSYFADPDQFCAQIRALAEPLIGAVSEIDSMEIDESQAVWLDEDVTDPNAHYRSVHYM